MKNIIKISSLILAFVIIGCDAIDDSRFQSNRTSGWIEFVGDSATLLSTDGPTLTIETEYNVPINREDTTITYDVQILEGDVPGFATGTFTTTVSADTADAADIVFDIDPDNPGNYVVQYTILSTSNPDVIVGLDGDNPIQYTISVCNNDFPLNYTGTTYFDGNLDDPVGTFDLVLTPTANPNEYTMNNAWGNFVFDLIGSFDGGFVYSPVLFTKNADNTVSIVPTDPEEPRYLGTADTAEGDPIENKFDPCTKELTYLLNQGVFTGDFTVGVVLNPN